MYNKIRKIMSRMLPTWTPESRRRAQNVKEIAFIVLAAAATLWSTIVAFMSEGAAFWLAVAVTIANIIAFVAVSRRLLARGINWVLARRPRTAKAS